MIMKSIMSELSQLDMDYSRLGQILQEIKTLMADLRKEWRTP